MYNVSVAYGCIAQLARAFGSYPECHWFKSNYSHQYGPVVKRPKTPPFHGGNTGSNPVRVTKREESFKRSGSSLFLYEKGRDSNRRERSGRKQSGGLFLPTWACRRGSVVANPVRVTVFADAEYPVRVTKIKNPPSRRVFIFRNTFLSRLLCFLSSHQRAF